LAPNPNWKNINSKGWYKNMTIGRNNISSWMFESAQKIGIDTKKIKITNHSVRASAVSNLAKQGIGEEQLIKLTGHSNTHSIKPYLQMDADHHKKIIESMRNEKGSLSGGNFSSTASTSTDSSYKGNYVYNNCVFNFN
jgi:integrase